jgi:gliding motility-associated-like protein
MSLVLYRLLGLGLLYLLSLGAVQAQGPYATWYFGWKAGLRFTATGPLPLTDGQLNSPAACTALSDSTGNILLYSDGEQVWNRQHQVIAGGDSLGGNSMPAQGVGALLAPHVGQVAYLFGMYYAAPMASYAHGRPWAAEVDLRANGGLGQVVRRLQPVVADSVLTRLGEQAFAGYQALVRHANGTDYWLITRLFRQGTFLASRITGSGTWPCPVTVTSPAVVPGSGGQAYINNTLAASPDGRTLLYNDVNTSYLLQFDPATGRVSTPTPLTFPALSIPADGVSLSYTYGAVFSPDGSKCYLSRYYTTPSTSAVQVVQYDLAAGSLPLIATSGLEISAQTSAGGGRPFGMQRGPDGAIYLAVDDAVALDVIAAPNARGAACQYLRLSQPLAGRVSFLGLPLIPNDANLPAMLSLASVQGCVGQPLLLRVGGLPGSQAGDSLVWTLGVGQRPMHTTTPTLTITYPLPGTYPLHVALRRGGRTLLTASATASVLANPTLRLGPDTTLCPEQSYVRLRANAQPVGTTYQWADGTTLPDYLARQPGLYWLEVRSPAGCVARDTVLVRANACPPVIIPDIITPNGDAQNDYFVLQGLTAADWTITLYNRWGRQLYHQVSYDNRWQAADQPAGLYYYLLQNPLTGQQMRGWVEVIK